ncbi:MAG TPA: hypothetical protein VN039_09590 [Nitrospira sp.]|nr:hypothetical protein [Nitrospira sp.]
MGMLYKRGKVFWIKYYLAGRPIRESTGTTKQKEAERFLKDREGRVAMGTPALPRIDRIRYDELADDLRRHYEVTNCRDLKEADVRLKPLKAFFSGRRASGIGGPDIERYVQVRQGAAVSNGAINRELSTLGRMLRLAYEHGKLQRVPMIHRLKEAAPRQGFFEREQFAAVRKQLPPDLQAAVTIAYTYGWRMQSEVLALTLSQLDLEAGTLRLEPGTTKNAEGRLVYLTPELQALMSAQVDRVKALARQLNRLTPLSLSARDRQVSRETPPGLSQGLAHRLGTGGACGDVAP